MFYIKDALGYAVPGMLILLIYFMCLHLCLLKKGQKISVAEHFGIAAFGICLIVIFSVTISPVYGYTGKINTERVNLIPGKVLLTAQENMLNFIGNVFMFLPIGFLLPIISRRYRKFGITLLGGFGMSLFIEIVQLFNSRGTDVDDIILNTLGTVIGYIIAKLVLELFPGVSRNTGILRRDGRKRLKKDRGIVFSVEIISCLFVLGFGTYQRQELCAMDADIVSEDATFAQPEPKSEAEQAPLVKNIDSVYTESNYIMVWDMTQDAKVYGENENETIAPASTTKILTALTAMDYCDLSDVVVVGDEVEYISADASVAGVMRGDELTVEQLLEGMLLPSGNDAAYVLACYAGSKINGSSTDNIDSNIKAFVEKMNEKAKACGATNSKFMRPDGYDMAGQHTTAYDMSCIAEAFLKSKKADGVLRNIVKQPCIRECFADGTKDITWENTNELLQEESPYYCPDAIGLKTGSTAEAGKCLISAVEIDGETYVIAVMKDTEEGRYEDTLRIYEMLKEN